MSRRAGQEEQSIEISIDPGDGYQPLGTVPFMSVPYALVSKRSLEDLDEQDLQFTDGIIRLSGDPTPTTVDVQGMISNSMIWNTNNDTVFTNASVGIGTSQPNRSLLSIQSADPQIDKPLFEVRNDAGNPVFAVFNDGVMVYVDEEKKGVKGGFAVGGYSTSNKGITQEYMRITPDSVRIWVPEGPSSKGVKGGFAVGGYSTGSKSVSRNFLEVTSANTSIFFDTTTREKGFKGGFAVGGYSTSKAGEPDQLMSLTRSNYLIGQDAGVSITTGKNNTFFGWEAGFNNTSGNENIFVGRLSGHSNVGAEENIFIGNESGFSTETGYGNIYMGNQAGYYRSPYFVF